MARNDLDAIVIGGGSFGTTLASLMTNLGRRVRLWVRRAEQADEINREHRNSRYLPDFDLPVGLEATTDLTGSVKAAPVLVVAPGTATLHWTF